MNLLKKITAVGTAAVMLGCGMCFNAGDCIPAASAAVTQSTTVNKNSLYTYLSATEPKPVKVKAKVSGSSATLSWTKSKCSYYRIYFYKNGKWGLSRRVAASKNTYTYKNLKSGYHFFKVVPINVSKGGKLRKSRNNPAVKVKIQSAAKTPVALHGRLSVKGNHIVDSHGKIFKIKGMSTHGIMWENFSDILSYNSMKTLRDDWKINTIRVAMYTEEYGGYTTGSNFALQATKKVENAVANAKKLGLYVIIDWHVLHDQNPNKHIGQAKAFFAKMAKKYRNYNNVIFEICNEPNGGVTWAGSIKKYCQTIVRTIRAQKNNSIIVCGTATWSQDIDKVIGNRIKDKNCVYSLHFYANTHTDWLRNRLRYCYKKGLPVLVTEFGTCDASGNGGYNSYQTKLWLKLLDSLKVGYVNWSLSGKAETASAFKPGTYLKNIRKGTSQLTASGNLVRSWFRAH